MSIILSFDSMNYGSSHQNVVSCMSLPGHPTTEFFESEIILLSYVSLAPTTINICEGNSIEINWLWGRELAHLKKPYRSNPRIARLLSRFLYNQRGAQFLSVHYSPK